MNKRLGLLVAVGIVGIAAWGIPAQGNLILNISQGTTNISVVDNGVGDVASSTTGSIIYYGTVGAFSLNIISGTSNNPGNSQLGLLQISSLNVKNTATGQETLTLSLGDTGFSLPGTSSSVMLLGSSIGGTFTSYGAGDSITFQSYADAGNVQFGTGTTTGAQTHTMATAGTGPFSLPKDDLSTTMNRTQPLYSLSNVTTIKLSANAQANISGTTSIVPEPSALALLSMAGLGLLGYAWRRRRRAAM